MFCERSERVHHILPRVFYLRASPNAILQIERLVQCCLLRFQCPVLPVLPVNVAYSIDNRVLGLMVAYPIDAV